MKSGNRPAVCLMMFLFLPVLTAETPLARERIGDFSSDEKLTLDQAVVSALEHYPAVLGSVAERDAAEALVKVASADQYPTVGVGASLDRYQKPMVVFPIHELSLGSFPPFDKTLIRAHADLRYNLFDGGARGARIQEAESRVEAQSASLSMTRQALTARVAATYLEILARRQTLEARDQSLEALRAELARIRQLLDVGRAARIEILRVEASIARDEAERIAVASALDLTETELARLTGIPRQDVDASRLVSVSLRGGDFGTRDELLDMALQANPAAQEARRQLDVADAGVDLADSDLYPRLDALAQYINYGSTVGESSLEWNVGVQVSYPLFTGGAVSGNRARARALRRRAEEGLRLVETDVAQELDRSLSAIEEAQARIQSLETAVEASKEVSRIERLRLEVGTGIQTDYLQAESDLVLTQAGLIEARYTEIRARIELARVTGALDLDWISAHLRSEP